MQTRRGTKGPGQGDPAVAQDKRDGVEDALEDPVEAKPSSTTEQSVSVEREMEAMKESTSKLEAEVRMLRTFAQDTIELLNEMREERLGSKPATSAPAYYGAQNTAGTAKFPMQTMGASAALYGAMAALPEQKGPSAALPTAFDRVVNNSSVGYIVGNIVHFKGVLEDCNNLHTVISHVRAFKTHLRVHGDSSQLFGRTISAKALRDLRLHDQNVAELTLSQWEDVFAFNFRQSRTDLQDIFACLRKVQMEDVVTNSRISRDYYVKNYRAILGYLYILEEFREQTERYTGIACNFPKPEASRTRNGREGGIKNIYISREE
jgi:hypothetical protein